MPERDAVKARRRPLQTRGSFLILLFLFAAGCTHSGPMALFPGGTEEEGFIRKERFWIYERDGLRIRAGEVRSARGIAGKLINDGYVIFSLGIENRTGKKVMIDPAQMSLRFGAMGYEKPLDFTDFYDLSLSHRRIREEMKNVREIFYDLTVAVPPGGATSKLLAFRPMGDDAGDAELVIKNIYIGTEVLDVRFPFELRPVKSEKDY